MDSLPLQHRPLLSWPGSAHSSTRRLRCKRLNLKSLLLVLSCLTCLTFFIAWLSSFVKTPFAAWVYDSRRIAQAATSKLRGPFGSASSPYKHSSEADIRKRVGDRKFLVRDWTPYLGWNNVRYTIETGLTIANLLGRELVLPGFTWATACEFSDDVCAKLTPQLNWGVPVDLATVTNRSQYPDPDEGKTVLAPMVPSHHWKGWVLPLDVMLDVPYMASHWNSSISLKDYLELTSPTTDPNYYPSLLGMSTGNWGLKYNHGLSYWKAPNARFCNFSQTMVDRLPLPIEPLVTADTNSSARPSSVPPQVYEKCLATLHKVEKLQPRHRQKRDITPASSSSQDLKTFPSWNDDLISGDQLTGELSVRDNHLLERCISSRGYRSAYGYTLAGWWMKAPVGPTKYFRKVETLVGWWDELHARKETILHLEGEHHNGYPPASMLWTSLEGRQKFEKLVRTAVKPPEIYDRVAAKLELKMRARCGGRAWRAAHMRRGDFVTTEWTTKNITRHFNRIKSAVDASITMMQAEPDLLKPARQAYSTSLELPKLGDPMYLATNARDKEEVAFLRKQNVVLLSDLLDDDDKAELGFSAVFMDTLSILEQCLIMRSAFFFGDAHSSVNGWIVNRRTSHGIDERLTKTEYLKFPGDGQ